MTTSLDRRGLAYSTSAYIIWGFFPIFMAALKPANALEIVSHRSLWTLVVCIAVVLIARRWRTLVTALSDRGVLLRLSAAAVLIGVNWGVMVYAVVTDRVGSASLGYYFNPLITIALAFVFLGERLRRNQIIAMAIACLAVIVVAIDLGGLPWISLTLAVSFALYSLIKKSIGPKVDAVTGLTVETLVLVPVAAGILWWGMHSGSATFLQRGEAGLGISHDIQLAATGVWTAVPLIIFAAAAGRIPLAMTGMLQYIAPTMTFILAVTYFGEQMSPGRWLGFGLVWIALAVFSADMWQALSRRKKARAVEAPEPLL